MRSQCCRRNATDVAADKFWDCERAVRADRDLCSRLTRSSVVAAQTTNHGARMVQQVVTWRAGRIAACCPSESHF